MNLQTSTAFCPDVALCQQNQHQQQQQRQEQQEQQQQEEVKQVVSPEITEEQSSSFFLGKSTFSVYEEMAAQLRQLGWSETRCSALVTRCDLVLGDRSTIPYTLLRCERLPATSRYSGYRWINYFKGSHRLTRKASMARLLSAADATCDKWMPRSFVLGGDKRKRPDDSEEFLNWVEANPGRMLIIKPSCGSKGKNILLMRSFVEIKAFVDDLNSNGCGVFVAQRYIENPLLFYGKKFDVRVWVLLKTPYVIYVFSQGSCRLSSLPYDCNDTSNKLVHITNHCLQEGAPQFGELVKNNELWFSELAAYLRGLYNKDVLGDIILPQIVNIVVRTLLAMRGVFEVLPDAPYKCFQLFGYDLLIDDQLNVFLLEINGSPGVATEYLQSTVRETFALVNGGDASREWDTNAVCFVKLWEEGDLLPEGVSCL